VDETYAEWVKRLAKRKFATASPAVRAEVLSFFSGASRPQHISSRRWRRTMTLVESLRRPGA
jgi:hypothetical protein